MSRCPLRSDGPLDKSGRMTAVDVSKRMMVSNGNVTGLVERLVESGHLDRRTSDSTARAGHTAYEAGRADFARCAEHELDRRHLCGLGPKDVANDASWPRPKAPRGSPPQAESCKS